MALTDAAWQEALERDAVLAAAERKARGVVHTPPAIARFVARAVLELLESELDVGAAGPDAPPFVIVDPAVGTGVFPAALLELLGARGPRPMRASIVGLDVDGAAIERADRVLGEAARAAGVTVTLRQESALEREPRFEGTPIVVGNPPWAGRSASRGAGASEALLDDFRRDEHGAPLHERKIGVLSDDYVRFVRWSVEVVRRSPHGGVLGLVTNASWLDGPVHRAMRAALVRWLDVLVLVDLGGSALVSRHGGARDENVFGVRPGAVLVLGARRPRTTEPRSANVCYARLSGSRQSKLCLLEGATLQAITNVGNAASLADAVSLAPRAPHFALVPRAAVSAAYAAAPSLPDWMPFHREGIQTNRDEFCVDTERARLLERVAAFVEGTLPTAQTPAGSGYFDLERARTALARAMRGAHRPALLPDADSADASALLARCAYRPLDPRVFVTHPSVCHRPRPDLLAAMARSELALVTTRKDRGALPFRHFAVTDVVPDNCLLSARSSCRARAFPTHDPQGRPNLGDAVVERVGAMLGRPPTPRLVASYVAAFVGAPSYQRAFDEILRVDFPRIPWPRDQAEFGAIGRAGASLVAAWVDPVDPAAPLDLRARTLVIGHHRVLERIERERPELAGEALARASAIVRAEDRCDAAIREPLGRMASG